MKNQYYHSLLCVSVGGGQVVFKIKPQNKNKVFVSALARFLLSHFVGVFVVHSEGSLVAMKSLVRGCFSGSSKVISVF